MPRFVVLLRGVNVGKGNRVPMAEFTRLLEELGYGQVRTLLNSGNAVVNCSGRSTARHAKAIAERLRIDMGLVVPVVVKASSEFRAIVSENPIIPPDDEHSRFLVVFSQQAGALRDLRDVAPLIRTPERFVIGRRAAYLHCAGGILESKAASALLGQAGRGVTTRNWATVLKIRDLLHEAGASPSGTSS